MISVSASQAHCELIDSPLLREQESPFHRLDCGRRPEDESLVDGLDPSRVAFEVSYESVRQFFGSKDRRERWDSNPRPPA